MLLYRFKHSNMLQAKYITFIFIIHLFRLGKPLVPFRNLSNIYNFAAQLRNSTDDVHEFIAMIQTIFCPEQPVCTDGGVQNTHDTLRTLPATLTVDNRTIGLESIKTFIGMCCLYCSCSENCQEEDTCCLSKFYSKHTPKNQPVKQECIVATVRGYNRKTARGSNNARYFMTTQCFEDKTNSSVVSKCETPDPYNIDDTVPVTSLRTGRTYWNKHCATCNSDTENIEQWNAKLDLRTVGFVYFDANRFGVFEVNSLQELHILFASSSEIVYTPPVNMEDNRCFERQGAITCRQKQEAQNKSEISFFRQACEQFYNPVYIVSVVRKHIFPNIFCFLCLEDDILEPVGDECTLDDTEHRGNTQIEMTAILDYRIASKMTISETHHPHYLEEKQKSCPCDKVYDYYKMLCRPLLCPVGEILLGCHCIQHIKNLSGMPVYLKLKVMPVSEHQFTAADLRVRNFHTNLKKLLQMTVSNIVADIAAIFRFEKEVSPYYLCIAVVRTKTGYDTKKTLKTFMPFLDSSRSLEFSSINITFSVHFLTRVLLWYEKDSHRHKLELKAENLDEAQQNLTLVYSNIESTKSRYFHNRIQVLSPLMYCKQVELDPGEFIEEHGKIRINNTSKPKYSCVWDFYKVAPSKMRICADEYFDHSEPSLSTLKFVSNTVVGLCLVLIFVLDKTV